MAGSIPSNVWETSAISDADLQFISGKVKNKNWSKLTSELGITRLDILKFWNQSRRGIVCGDLLKALDRTDNDLALMFKGWKTQNPSNVSTPKKPAGQIAQVPKRPHPEGGNQTQPKKAAKYTPQQTMTAIDSSYRSPSVSKTPHSDGGNQTPQLKKEVKHAPQESRPPGSGLFRPKDIKPPAGGAQGIPVITIPRSKPQGAGVGPGSSTTQLKQAAPAHTPDVQLKSLQGGQQRRVFGMLPTTQPKQEAPAHTSDVKLESLHGGQQILDLDGVVSTSSGAPAPPPAGTAKTPSSNKNIASTSTDKYSILRRTIIVNIWKKTEDGEKRGDKNPHDHFRGEYTVTDGKKELTLRVFGKLTQESIKLLKEGNTLILHGVVLYKNHVSVEKLTTIMNFDGDLTKLRPVDLKRYGAEPLKVIKSLQKKL